MLEEFGSCYRTCDSSTASREGQGFRADLRLCAFVIITIFDNVLGIEFGIISTNKREAQSFDWNGNIEVPVRCLVVASYISAPVVIGKSVCIASVTRNDCCYIGNVGIVGSIVKLSEELPLSEFRTFTGNGQTIVKIGSFRGDAIDICAIVVWEDFLCPLVDDFP